MLLLSATPTHRSRRVLTLSAPRAPTEGEAADAPPPPGPASGYERTWICPLSIGTKNGANGAGSVTNVHGIPRPEKPNVISSGGALGPSPLSCTAKNASLPTGMLGKFDEVQTPLITAMLSSTFRQSIWTWPRKPEERFSIWASPLALPSSASVAEKAKLRNGRPRWIWPKPLADCKAGSALADWTPA